MGDTDDELVTALAQVADGLVRHSIRDFENILTQIVASAAQTVPGADGGGLARVGAGIGCAQYATDPAIGELDRLQHALDQGPAIEAAGTDRTPGVVTGHDLAGPGDHDRWPTFTSAAVRAGYYSVVSTRLAFRPGGPRSALTLYARRPGVFTEQARTVAGLFAAQASLLLYGADQAAHLQRAVDSRDVIGQAKGILMERFDIDPSQAFELLISSSQETNIKLIDVARWLTTSRTRRGDGAEPAEAAGGAESAAAAGRTARKLPHLRAVGTRAEGGTG